MAVNIGNIGIRFSAVTAPLTKGLQGVSGRLGGLGKSVGMLAAKFGPLGAAITGVAGVAGMGLLIKRSFDSIDSLAKMSDAIGVTTQSLAGMRRAGERSGVAAEAVDKGLARMQKTLSSAFAAGGSKNLDMLGLSLEELRGMSADDQFLTIADAINRVGDQTDRTRLSMEMFGRDGVGMLKIVGKGAEAARGELAKAAELGLAPRREEAARVESMNDAIADAKDSFVGLANSIAVFVAPAIQSIAERVTQFGVWARQAFEGFRPHLTQAWNTLKAFGAVMWEWNPLIVGARKLFSLLGETVGTTFGDLKDLLLDGMIISEFAYSNIGDVAEFAWTRVKLGAVSLWEDLKHGFTVVLPTAVKWFFDNGREFLFTYFDLWTTVLINIGQNVRNIFTGIWNWLKGGDWNVAFVPLTEGFHNSIGQFPKIAGREMSALEKSLKAQADGMGESLSGRLGEFMDLRRAELLGVPEVEESLAVEPSDALGELPKAIGEALKGPQAMLRDSAEAVSFLNQDLMRGDAASRTEQHTKRLVDLERENKRLLEELVRQGRGQSVLVAGGEI